jgi:hypothetical protein
LARKNAAAVATFDDEPPADPSDRTVETEPRRHEILGLVALCLTLLAALSIASYDANGGDDWVGVLGAWIADVLASAFGIAAWVVPFELGLLAVRLFGKHARPIGAGRLASVLVVVLVGCAMLHLAMPDQSVLGGHLPGGAIGEVIGEVLRSLLGLVGAFVVCTTVLLLTIILRTSLSIVGTTRRLVEVTRSGLTKLITWMRSLIDAFRGAREIEDAPEPLLVVVGRLAAVRALEDRDGIDVAARDGPTRAHRSRDPSRSTARVATSSAREPTLSFLKMLPTWFATVRADVPRSRAISAFERPASIAATTSCSAGVSASLGATSSIGKARTIISPTALSNFETSRSRGGGALASGRGVLSRVTGKILPLRARGPVARASATGAERKCAFALVRKSRGAQA